MACHILYGRPYCNDAKEGVGGITPQNSTEGDETQQGLFSVDGTWCATAQGIHFRSTAIVQSVSGDAMDVPLTTEFLGWSHGLGARERQSCPFFWK